MSIRLKKGDVEYTLAINRSVSVAKLQGASYPDLISIRGCGLKLSPGAPTGDYEVYLSVITPHLSLATDGKSPSLEGYEDAIEEVIGKAARQAHRAMEKQLPARPASHRSVVLAHLQEAIAVTSEDGKYIFSQRNLFYRVRPFVEQETGQALGWSNFTSILTDYEAEHGNIADLIRDERGSFHDLDSSIGLGTTAVANYRRPDWQFHKLLFCEKEDHVRILQQAEWPERHDCAVMSSKGYASRAARDVIDAIADTAAHEPVTVFCIHDADAAGSMISQSLQEATRARGRRRIEIIDIGLQPWDAVAKGLAIENVSYGKPQPVAAYIVAREDRRDWTQWLQNHRVELNAMTPGEMIRWLDGQGLKVFLDVAYERAGDDFLTRKVLPALDASRRLAVISTPAAFASVPDASGLPQPNWLCREIDHFFDQRGAQAQSATIVVLGARAPDDRFPGRLATNARWDWVDLRGFKRFALQRDAVDAAVVKIVAWLLDVPDELLPALHQEQR